jgi:hypothetical protein
MQSTNLQSTIESAIATVAEMSAQRTDGTWLEDVAV